MDYRRYNFNADRFCCSNRGAELRKAILKNSNYPVHPLNIGAYSTSCGGKEQARVVYLNTTGIVSPNAYTVAPQAPDYIWCSRMPNALSQNGKPPCAGNKLI